MTGTGASPFAVRGIIEGFYGNPWTHEQRLELIAFMGARGMNTFVYAPKDDSLIRRDWRTPYAGSDLERMAALTGGRAYCPGVAKDLDGVFDKIREELGARYSLGYLSSDPRTDGSWRGVEIRLLRKDLKGVKLRTRSGYFAPFKPGR